MTNNQTKEGWLMESQNVGDLTQNLLDIAEGRKPLDDWNQNMSDLIIRIQSLHEAKVTQAEQRVAREIIKEIESQSLIVGCIFSEKRIEELKHQYKIND